MRRSAALAAWLAVLAAPALADPVSERPEATAVTVYNIDGRGLALIRETRTVDLPAGPSTIRFRGVASGLVPQTVGVEGLPEPVSERNFDYDLLSPASLLAKSIDKPVRIVRTNPKTGVATEETAIVRSGPYGAVLEIAGRFEALRCSGLPERLVFDEIPEGLADEPTLSLRTHAARAGRHKVALTYLTEGMSWKADYVARLRPGGKTLDLTGWITLRNEGDTGFARAPTQVVAGRLNTTGESVAIQVERRSVTLECWPTDFDWGTPVAGPSGASDLIAGFAPPPPPPPPAPPPPAMYEEVLVTARKMARQEDLGDYKLYTLPEPTTVAARQTKQVLFLDQSDVPFERIYSARVDEGQGGDQPRAPDILLRFQNTRAAGLGKPLPAGAVAVMEQTPQGRPVLAGEDRLRDMAIGLPVEITVGRATDLTVQPVLVANTTVARQSSQTWEVTAANAKTVPVTLELRGYGAGLPNFRVTAETHPHGTKGGDPVWTLKLAPGAVEVLRYTVRWRND